MLKLGVTCLAAEALSVKQLVLVGCTLHQFPWSYDTIVATENRQSPKRRFHLPTIHFQVRTLSFREGVSVGECMSFLTRMPVRKTHIGAGNMNQCMGTVFFFPGWKGVRFAEGERSKSPSITGWWFQICFWPLFGEDSHFDLLYTFQMGWNHQPDHVHHGGLTAEPIESCSVYPHSFLKVRVMCYERSTCFVGQIAIQTRCLSWTADLRSKPSEKKLSISKQK